MNCILIRTEHFGSYEFQSYGHSIINNPEKCLSVYKAEIIREINEHRNDLYEYPYYDEHYGRRHEDRFYLYDLKGKIKNMSPLRKIFQDDEFKLIVKEFEERVFKNQHIIDLDWKGDLPEGWEEIIPENYNIQEVAFKNKGENE